MKPLAPLAKRRWQISQRSNGIVISEHQARGASQAWNLFMVKMGREGLNPDRCNFDVRRVDDDAPERTRRGPEGLQRRFAL